MQPIVATSLITQGIALYAPPLVEIKGGLLTFDLYYSQNNPLFAWLTCDNSTAKIWTKTANQTLGGTIFLYEGALALGFYTLVLSLIKPTGQTIKGQLSLGVIQPTPYLVIGLPYSIYPPIVLA